MSKDNVIKEDLIAKFYQYLNDMDYLRASETIGILKVFGEKTDVYEVELLFGEKKYDQIIHRYMPVVKEFEDALLDVIDKSELDDSIIPDHKVYEYIAASYSMLGSHDRSWQILAFSRDDEVDYDYYCFEYCAWMAYLSGDYSDWEDKWNGGKHYDSLDWRNRYNYLIARESALLYKDNEAAIDIKENSSEPDEYEKLQSALINRICKLSSFDPAFDYVENCIREEKRFPQEIIIDLLLDCVQKSLEVVDRPKSLSDLHNKLNMLSGTDVIEYLSIENILSPLTAYRDMTDYMKDRIVFLLSLGNRDLANTLFEIYYHVLYADSEDKAKLSKVNDSLQFWEELLFEYYNNNLYSKKIREYENSKVSKCLTPHGAVMYKAAQWQLMTMTEDTNAYVDAGMLCLSYMRIIEYELNQRVIKRIVPYIDRIIEARNAQIEMFNAMKNEGKLTEKKWGRKINNINERWGKGVLEAIRDSASGVELGKLSWFFQNFMSDRPKEVKPISDVVEMILKEEKILSDSGLVALKQQKAKDSENGFRFVDMTGKDRREKYRNPPAHTRFVSLSTAMKCVEYVNKAIIKIDEYTINQENMI